MSSFVSFQDATTVTLTEADLIEKKCKDRPTSPKRDIPCADGLEWWIKWYPASSTNEAVNLSVYLYANKSVKATFSCKVGDSSIHKTSANECISPRGKGWVNFASYEELRPLFCDGKLTLTVSVTFEVFIANAPSTPRVFQLCDQIAPDFTIEVATKQMKVHKHFISIMSPVFHTMLAKSKTRKLKITDFDFETVKATIDFCYGHKLPDLSVETVIAVLRFAEHYQIKAVTIEFETFLVSNLSDKTVCPLLRYAHENFKTTLLNDCAEYWKTHEAGIKQTEEFAMLPATIIVDVLKAAFDLKSNFDILHHAQTHGMDSVVNHLAETLFDKLTLGDFCPAVCFAWETSRENLKMKCSAFFNERQNQVMQLVDFHNLPPEVIGSVLKMAFNMKAELPDTKQEML